MVRDADLPAIPDRSPEAHKGTFGRALIVAGSRRMPGAAVLATEAALRSGAGLVTLAIPGTVLHVVSTRLTCSTFLPLPQTAAGTFAMDGLRELLREAVTADAVALGPGLSQDAEAAEVARQTVGRLSRPIVLDADGLNAFAGRAFDLQGCPGTLVLTPHPGEMGRLTGLSAQDVQADRQGVAVRFALDHRAIVVLKGHRTIVTDGNRVFVNPTGNPGMATGGAGDVLTGMIAGLLAQGIPAYDAAKTGAFVHGLAGDIARAEVGEISLIATDILAKLPAAFSRFQAGHCRPVT